MGTGATVVVGAIVVVTGWASAGVIPPVTAVREITAPEARTTATPRLRHIRNGELVVAVSFMICPPRRWSDPTVSKESVKACSWKILGTAFKAPLNW